MANDATYNAAATTRLLMMRTAWLRQVFAIVRCPASRRKNGLANAADPTTYAGGLLRHSEVRILANVAPAKKHRGITAIAWVRFIYMSA